MYENYYNPVAPQSYVGGLPPELKHLFEMLGRNGMPLQVPPGVNPFANPNFRPQLRQAYLDALNGTPPPPQPDRNWPSLSYAGAQSWNPFAAPQPHPGMGGYNINDNARWGYSNGGPFGGGKILY